MTHEEAFLQDIAAHPDDDAPRLICADWIEEHGDPERAELIRVQCELARLGSWELVRQIQLRRRERELLATRGKEWSKPLRAYSSNFDFRRGFADRITMPASTFLHHAADVARITPLYEVKLRTVNSLVEKLARCPALARVSRLDLDFNKLGVGRLETLLKSRHLKNLTHLDLSNNALTSGAGAVLARAKNLSSLAHLTLDNNHLGVVGWAGLAEAPWLGQVQTLNLKGCEINAEGLRKLAESPGAAGLRRLNLTYNRMLGNAALEALAGSPHLSGLTSLVLRHCYPPNTGGVVTEHHFGERGLRALVQSPHLQRLVELKLADNWSVGHELAGLADATRPLPALTALDLTNCGLPARGPTRRARRAHRRQGEVFIAFIRSPFVSRLTRLTVAHNEISGEALEALISSPALANVHELDMSRYCIDRAGAVTLAEKLDLPALRHLDLSGNEPGDRGVAALAASPRLARLQTLQLNFCRLTSRAAGALADSPHLANLAALVLCDNQAIHGKAAARLRERFGERVLLGKERE
jgi:uncharacterized protein (TIGR02996 family)